MNQEYIESLKRKIRDLQRELSEAERMIKHARFVAHLQYIGVLKENEHLPYIIGLRIEVKKNGAWKAGEIHYLESYGDSFAVVVRLIKKDFTPGMMTKRYWQSDLTAGNVRIDADRTK